MVDARIGASSGFRFRTAPTSMVVVVVPAAPPVMLYESSTPDEVCTPFPDTATYTYCAPAPPADGTRTHDPWTDGSMRVDAPTDSETTLASEHSEVAGRGGLGPVPSPQAATPNRTHPEAASPRKEIT